MSEENTAAVTFGINDLVFTLKVYEACAQRGAFRADEMANVGAVYDRLRDFLVANGAIQPQGAVPAENSEETQGETN